MVPPPFPDNEPERLASLRSFNLLDTPFEQVYDEVVSLASAICEMPYSAVSLIDANRQWFKAACGLGNVRETPREQSFCGYAILGHDLMYVYDARQDERFVDNPLVTGNPQIRSYAGVPLASSEGFNLGTLCVFSDQPKELSPVQQDALRRLGRLVTSLFEARKREAWLAKVGLVLNNLPEEILLLGPVTRRCLYANRVATQAFEQTGRMALGQKVVDLVEWPQRQGLDESLQQLLSGTVSQIVLEQERSGLDERGRSFRYPVEVRIRRLPHAKDPVFVWIGTDISERKRLDRMKKELVSILGHELRTPLTSIKGSLGILTSGMAGAVDEPVKGMLDLAESNADRLITLVNEFLDLQKAEYGAMVFKGELLQAEDVIEEAMDAIKGMALAKGITVNRVGSGNLTVYADRQRLVQILLNLLSNAVKHSPEDAAVDIGAWEMGAMTRFAVTDRGPGVPPEFKPYLFEVFSQADKSNTRTGKGTGLGLAIVRTFAERMKGRAGCDCPTGGPTTFHVDLPSRPDGG